MELIFLISSDSGYWGKGKDFWEAFRNSNSKIHHRIQIYAVLTEDPSGVSLDPVNGKVISPEGSKVFNGTPGISESIEEIINS